MIYLPPDGAAVLTSLSKNTTSVNVDLKFLIGLILLVMLKGKNEIAGTNGRNELSLKVAGLCGEEFIHLEEARSKAAAPAHRKEPVEVAASCVRCPGHVIKGGGPGADPGYTGEIISLGWLVNASVFPSDKLEEVAGRGRSGCLCSIVLLSF